MRSGIFDGHHPSGSLAIILLGAPSNSLLTAAQEHGINPTAQPIPVKRGACTHVDRKEVTSTIRPVTVAWDNTNQPTIMAMDIAKNHCQKDLWDKLSKAWTNVEKAKHDIAWKEAQKKLNKRPWAELANELTALLRVKGGDEASGAQVYGARFTPLHKGDTFTCTFRANPQLIDKLRADSNSAGIAFRRTRFGNPTDVDKENDIETKIPFPSTVDIQQAKSILHQIQGHRVLFFARDGHSMVARVPNAKEEEAWQLIAGRKAPPKQQYEIDHLPRALIADDLAGLLKQHLGWETEVVRMKISGNKQAPWKKA